MATDGDASSSSSRTGTCSIKFQISISQRSSSPTSWTDIGVGAGRAQLLSFSMNEVVVQIDFLPLLAQIRETPPNCSAQTRRDNVIPHFAVKSVDSLVREKRFNVTKFEIQG